LTRKVKLNFTVIDILVLLYILVQISIVIVFGFQSRIWLVLFYLASANLILFMSIIPRHDKISLLHFIKYIYPIVLLYLFYRILGIQTQLLNFQPQDALFYNLEKTLFKIYPTFALQGIMEVWLNETTYVLYCLGLILPIWAIIKLYKQASIYLFENFILALAIGSVISLTIISVLPVSGPDKALAEIYYLGIYGPRFSVIVPFIIDLLTPNTGSFPAIYFCLLTISAYYLWDFGKKYVIISFTLLISVLWGGIYLRYHYLADTLVALFIAFLAATIAGFFYYLKHGQHIEQK
jgi:hypothetical protein